MHNTGDVDLSAEPITEVELSADDLQGLAPVAAGLPTAATSVALERASVGPTARSTMGFSGPKSVGLLAAVLVATIAVSAQFNRPSRAGNSPEFAWTPISTRVGAPTDAQTSPTLFTNPFDETEVFELAPGLSQEQARQIVADMLIKRARERGVH